MLAAVPSPLDRFRAFRRRRSWHLLASGQSGVYTAEADVKQLSRFARIDVLARKYVTGTTIPIGMYDR